LSFLIAAIDTWDSYPEKACAKRAAMLTSSKAPGETVWFAGHWGFQYYCSQADMRQIVPGESILSPGDLLVLPIHPEENGFYRPDFGSAQLHPPFWSVETIEEVIWDDYLAAQTVPNFYGGIDPVVGRDHPRLRVVVYRIIQAWRVPR
jgi:hypothetical protein